MIERWETSNGRDWALREGTAAGRGGVTQWKWLWEESPEGRPHRGGSRALKHVVQTSPPVHLRQFGVPPPSLPPIPRGFSNEALTQQPRMVNS